MRGAPRRLARPLLVAAAAGACVAGRPLLEPAPLPSSARYEIGADVDPLRSMSTLRHPRKGRLDDFRGDPIDALETTLKWRWEKLRGDLTPESDLTLSHRFRDFFEKAAQSQGPEILPALLVTCQGTLLDRARELLGSRRRRVQLLRAADQRATDLAREERTLAARARRRGRAARQDGRVRRVRERQRRIARERAEVLGRLPEAELSLPRLAAYRDQLAGDVSRKVRELHGTAEQALRRLR